MFLLLLVTYGTFKGLNHAVRETDAAAGRGAVSATDTQPP